MCAASVSLGSWTCSESCSDTAGAGSRRFGLSSALRTHTKAPYKNVIYHGKR
jgi:hypothetical protein